MKNICVIPARGGSKRIPLKNLKEFCGVPIIEYAIKTAIDSDLFDLIVVSTDHPQIRAIANDYPISVLPRSSATASDTASTVDVIHEVLSKTSGYKLDNLCCLYPCTPLLTVERLKRGYDLLGEGMTSSLAVVKYSHPIDRALILDSGMAVPINPAIYGWQTQRFTSTYYDAGQFYWTRMSVVNKYNDIPCGFIGAVEIPESETQDIDSEEDWKLAEIKYEYMLRNKKF